MLSLTTTVGVSARGLDTGELAADKVGVTSAGKRVSQTPRLGEDEGSVPRHLAFRQRKWWLGRRCDGLFTLP